MHFSWAFWSVCLFGYWFGSAPSELLCFLGPGRALSLGMRPPWMALWGHLSRCCSPQGDYKSCLRRSPAFHRSLLHHRPKFRGWTCPPVIRAHPTPWVAWYHCQLPQEPTSQRSSLLPQPPVCLPSDGLDCHVLSTGASCCHGPNS